MILQRYIYKEILYKFFPICGLLLLIFISKYYVGYLAEAASGEISTQLVTTFLWLKIVASLPKMLPICLFISVILAFSRLVRDNELVIFHSSGVGRWFELSSAFRFALVFTLFFSLLVLYLAPYAQGRISELKAQAERDSDIIGISAGRFKEFSKGDRVVYVESLSPDRQSMEKVFLQVRQEDRLGVLASDTANFQWDEDFGNRYIVFHDGRRFVGNPGEQDYQITEYETYAVLIETSKLASAVSARPRALSTMILINSDQIPHQAELQWRISLILSCVLLSLLAVVLSGLTWNNKQYTLVFIGMLIYFIYSNLMGISKTMLSRDQISPFIGLWWVHIVLLVIIIIMYRLPGFRRARTNKKAQKIVMSKP